MLIFHIYVYIYIVLKVYLPFFCGGWGGILGKSDELFDYMDETEET